MASDIGKIIDIGVKLFPKQLKNVKVDFRVEQLGLRFVCKDKDIGYFELKIYNRAEEMVAYVEGKNKQGSKINIGQNINNYNKDFLYYCFHMARCCREFERTEKIDYSRGFDYYRKKAIDEYMKAKN